MKTKKTKEIGKKGQKYGKILGIKVISTSRGGLLVRVNNFLSHNTKFYIVTPNPELILMAQKNKNLKDALNGADFAVPDGIGLAQAAKFLSFKKQNIIITFFQGLFVGVQTFINKKYLTKSLPIYKGREVFDDLIRLANKNKWKVFLLGGLGNEAQMTESILGARNKNIRILSDRGPKLNKNVEPVADFDAKLEKGAIDKINEFAPDLLFVAMTNPKQEIWIHKNLPKLNTGGAMAVGGTFRYIAGLSKLPPKWMEELGLEWVWRLVTEPERIVRIWNAVIVFPWKVFLYKIAPR